MNYWIIIGFTLLLSFAAMGYLKSVFARASRVGDRVRPDRRPGRRPHPPVGRITDVAIVEGEGFLGDHYDPLNKKLVLSPENYQGSSAANVGVAAHECGHALQHQHHYFPLQLRMGSVYATHFATNAVYLIPFFIFLHIVSVYTGLLFMALGLGVLMFFNLITLPVEFDASARAKVVLQRLGIVQPGAEAAAVSSTLNAAGLTYVAAFIGTLLQFLYYVMLLSGNRSRN